MGLFNFLENTWQFHKKFALLVWYTFSFKAFCPGSVSMATDILWQARSLFSLDANSWVVPYVKVDGITQWAEEDSLLSSAPVGSFVSLPTGWQIQSVFPSDFMYLQEATSWFWIGNALCSNMAQDVGIWNSQPSLGPLLCFPIFLGIQEMCRGINNVTLRKSDAVKGSRYMSS